MKEMMSEYRDRFIGRAAAVLGGGPSLVEDMRWLPGGGSEQGASLAPQRRRMNDAG